MLEDFLLMRTKMIEYFDKYSDLNVENLKNNIDWWKRIETRLEYFMSDITRMYTYGKGAGARDYFSQDYTFPIKELQDKLNKDFDCNYNVCFLNRYDNQQMHLGWHSDDSPNIDNDHPIAVISVGTEREIWVRKIGDTGLVPKENKYLLKNNSLFIMPAGFQSNNQHRIPKCDRVCGTRISLTFRRYK